MNVELKNRYCYEHGYFAGIIWRAYLRGKKGCAGCFPAILKRLKRATKRAAWSTGRGRGQLSEKCSGIDIGKCTYLALCSLHTGQSRVTKWWAFVTPWIPVLRERRASRRERRADCALCSSVLRQACCAAVILRLLCVEAETCYAAVVLRLCWGWD